MIEGQSCQRSIVDVFGTLHGKQLPNLLKSVHSFLLLRLRLLEALGRHWSWHGLNIHERSFSWWNVGVSRTLLLLWLGCHLPSQCVSLSTIWSADLPVELITLFFVEVSFYGSVVNLSEFLKSVSMPETLLVAEQEHKSHCNKTECTHQYTTPHVLVDVPWWISSSVHSVVVAMVASSSKLFSMSTTVFAPPTSSEMATTMHLVLSGHINSWAMGSNNRSIHVVIPSDLCSQFKVFFFLFIIKYDFYWVIKISFI